MVTCKELVCVTLRKICVEAKRRPTLTGVEALQFSQAILNMSNALRQQDWLAELDEVKDG